MGDEGGDYDIKRKVKGNTAKEKKKREKKREIKKKKSRKKNQRNCRS